MREAVTVAKFNHPNIVAIYDVEDAGEAAFLAMEFVDGMSLENYLLEGRNGAARTGGAPRSSRSARGLEAAHHAGVIHCDIKPANILLGRDGAIKVTDFGIARSAVRATGNISGTFGTPGYLPPEALGSAAFTPMADLFGVGAVFYELLIGEPPHAGKTAQETLVRTATAPATSVRDRNKSVPPAIDDDHPRASGKGPEAAAARLGPRTRERSRGDRGQAGMEMGGASACSPRRAPPPRRRRPTAAIPVPAKLG